ncbi:MAG: hypothetical protein ACM3S5_14770 [Rhodospirillales bacterium]
MRTKIRVRVGPALRRSLDCSRQLAAVAAALLTPAALMALALGIWRLASDLKIAGEFAISGGLFSHWQVWVALAGLLQACASILNRYGRSGSKSTAGDRKRTEAPRRFPSAGPLGRRN